MSKNFIPKAKHCMGIATLVGLCVGSGHVEASTQLLVIDPSTASCYYGKCSWTDSYGYLISNSGNVAGASVVTDGISHTTSTSYFEYNYSASSRSSIGVSSYQTLSLGDMNDLGMTVGTIADNGSAGHLSIYPNLTTISPSGAQTPNPYYSIHTTEGVLFATGAGAINNSGQIALYAQDPFGTSPSGMFILSTDGSTQRIGSIGTQGTPHGMNDAGDVAGSLTTGGATHAFAYENGSVADLGTLGGANSFAYDINNAGTIAGYSQTASGATHAFVFANGSMTDLGTLGGLNSYAYAINQSGWIVGQSQLSNGTYHAFAYSAGTGMLDLNDVANNASWTLTDARDINDLGDVVGSATGPGNNSAFVLTQAVAVPEASQWAMMLCGLIAVSCIARRRVNR